MRENREEERGRRRWRSNMERGKEDERGQEGRGVCGNERSYGMSEGWRSVQKCTVHEGRLVMW